MMEDFNVTATSSSDLFSSNAGNHFQYKLPYPIRLEGHWYVSMRGIELPIPLNIHDNSTIEVTTSRGNKISYAVPNGFYNSITALQLMMRKARVPFSIGVEDSKTRIQFPGNLSTIMFKGPLAKILGFRDNRELTSHDTEPDFNFDLFRSIKTLYIEADFISTEVIGGGTRPVLAVTNYREGFSSTSSEYRLVTKSELEIITFKIKDFEGNLIPLISGGETIVRLHFSNKK